jgi:hypothetical protein
MALLLHDAITGRLPSLSVEEVVSLDWMVEAHI